MPESNTKATSIVGKAVAHDSARLHVTGQARYTDDIPEPAHLVHLAIGYSQIAHGRIESTNFDSLRNAKGVVGVVLAEDIAGENNYGTIEHDDPVLTTSLVEYVGQPIFAVAADSHAHARAASQLAQINYETLPAILTTDAAIAADSFVSPTQTMVRGSAPKAIKQAPHQLKRRVQLGGQDHFYLEGQIAMAVPQDDGGLVVYSSTQHPDEIQHLVAAATGRQASAVTVICRRMGGGFGGKETQPGLMACLVAVAADRFARPCKLRMDRDDDMVITGKRHDYTIDYHVGFDDSGRVLGLEILFASRCGRSADLSGPVNDRTLFHCDNTYFIEHLRAVSYRCKTHTVSNTAFRGFGGPQGIFAIEYVLDDVARTVGLDPLAVRQRNLYGPDTGEVTPYGQSVEDNISAMIIDQLLKSSDYRARRDAVEAHNKRDGLIRRGIAMTPVKFGISFTNTMLNQGGALIHLYKDGTVMLNHGGTEMGQGLFIKVAQVVGDVLGVSLDKIQVTASDTSKVPNASATAASSGSDINGMAAKAAADTLKARLVEVAVKHYGADAETMTFEDNTVRMGDQSVPFATLVTQAWMDRVSLSTTGFYKTPKIHFDKAKFSGRPFFYFAYGAAVTEVAVDVLTGESRIERVDILHDVGDSLNPAIDIGQVEGAFVQGAGWLTSEELWWDDQARLRTHAPSTYKIPTCSDVPSEFRVTLLADSPNKERTIYRSKAVGEPPFMLGISVFMAIRDALGRPNDSAPMLHAPATPESIVRAWRGVAGR